MQGITSLKEARKLLESKAPKGEFLAYINEDEAKYLKYLGGAGIPVNSSGIPSFFSIKSITRPFKKAVQALTKPVANILDKVIPNEIKPALPYIAAAFPFVAPAAFGSLAASMPGFGIQNAFLQQAVQRGILGAGLNSLSQLAQEGNQGEINLLRAVAAGAPAAFTTPGLAENLGANAELIREAAGTDPSFLSQVQSGGLDTLAKVAEFGQAGAEAPLFSLGKVQALAAPLGQQTTFDAIDYAQKALDDYNRQLDEFNKTAAEKTTATNLTRARAIYDSMTNTGLFGTDDIKGALAQLGLPADFFASGGIVGSRKGYKLGALVNIGKTVQKGYGKLKNFLARMSDDVAIETRSDYADDTGASLDIFLTPKSKKGKKGLDELVAEGSVIKDGDTYIVKDSEEFMGGAIKKDLKASGVDEEGLGYKSFKEGAGESEYGVPYYGYDSIIEAFNRPKKAEGGLMNLRMGGMPAEIDARQSGGFIPIGKAEKADDVPARLSQNEFVMTADAVRGMGQGNINLGAQRMYDIMKQYEPIGRALV